VEEWPSQTSLRDCFTSLLSLFPQFSFRSKLISLPRNPKWKSLPFRPTPTLSVSSAPEKWPRPLLAVPSTPASCRLLAFAPPHTPIPRAAPPSNRSASLSSHRTKTYTVPSPFLLSLKQTSRRFHFFFLTLAGRSRKQRRRFICQTSIRYSCTVSALIIIRLAISFTDMCVVAVKDVVSKLTPIITNNKLLVSVAAGVKLKDLQVTNAVYFFFFLFAFVYFVN